MLLAFGALAIGCASTLGGATGFGTSLLSMPLLLLVGLPVPEVVVVNLASTLITRLAVLYQSRRQADPRCIALLGAASIPGAWLGAMSIGLVPPQLLKPAAGALVALAGLRLAIRTRGSILPPTLVRQAAAGFVGGFLSTTTSLNGPPAALLLVRARLASAALIANLAGYFVVTNILSLAILGIRHEIPRAVLWPALPVFSAAAVAGNQIGGWAGRKLPTRRFHTVVTTLVIIAGITCALS